MRARVRVRERENLRARRHDTVPLETVRVDVLTRRGGAHVALGSVLGDGRIHRVRNLRASAAEIGDGDGVRARVAHTFGTVETIEEVVDRDPAVGTLVGAVEERDAVVGNEEVDAAESRANGVQHRGGSLGALGEESETRGGAKGELGARAFVRGDGVASGGDEWVQERRGGGGSAATALNPGLDARNTSSTRTGPSGPGANLNTCTRLPVLPASNTTEYVSPPSPKSDIQSRESARRRGRPRRSNGRWTG